MANTETPVMEHPAAEDQAETRKQRIRVRGEELLSKVRRLIHEGNVRRIVVISEEGTTLLEIPLTAGVVGAVMAPALVAIGAIAALATNYTLLIEARHPSEPRQPATRG
jgi:CBS domain-containing protein